MNEYTKKCMYLQKKLFYSTASSRGNNIIGTVVVILDTRSA